MDATTLPPLILASSSRYRQELLQRLGIKFESMSPDVDEDRFKDLILEPNALAETLAREKALAISVKHPEAVVIGSDQLVSHQGQILGKGHTAEKSVAQLLSLAGSTHELITAVCIIAHHKPFEFVNITRLTMRTLTQAEAERYVAADNPLDCAGSYKIESLGISLFQSIDTDDFTAITGLPLIQLSSHLRTLGYAIP
jgi:septum formation protein